MQYLWSKFSSMGVEDEEIENEIEIAQGISELLDA